ncbi:MAG: fibronectin type III domain-containing protein [Bacteroidales bacterium]|nr:fibronectin type III domain-containing protein [Bacteroidales bacterium]
MSLLSSMLGLTMVMAQSETPVWPEPPVKISVTSVDLKEVKFSVTPNAAGDDVIIVMTTARKTIDGKSVYEGAFDSIGPDDPVGKKYKNTTVLYTGAASADIAVPVNLDNNKVYYFGALSKTSGSVSAAVAGHAPVLTPAAFKFKDNMKDNFSPDVENPFKGMGVFEQAVHFKMETDGATTDFTANGGIRQEAVLWFPALDFPKDSNVRVDVSYGGWPAPDMVASRDSIVLEISKDDGRTFEILAVNRDYPDMTFNNKYIIIDDCPGIKAQLRLRVVCWNSNVWNFKLHSLSAEHMVFCSKPGKPSADIVYGNADGSVVGVKWSSGTNNETEWNLSWQTESIDGTLSDWSDSVKVEERFYGLTGPDDNQVFNVRVQAICGQKADGSRHLSEWVEAQNLQGGRRLPFTERFDDMEIKTSLGTKYIILPTLWQAGFEVGKNAFPENWTLNPQQDPTRGGKIRYLGLQSGTQKDYVKESDGSVAYNMHYKKVTSGFLGMKTEEYASEPNWFSTPLVQLLKRTNLVFDIAYGKFIDSVWTAVEETDALTARHKVALWISTDSGKTVNTAKPVWEADGTALAALYEGKTVEVDLSAYKGQIIAAVFGILGTEGETPDREYMLYFDNIGFTTVIPVVEDLAVSAVTSRTATLTWKADEDVTEWLVKIEGASLSSPRFDKVDTTVFVVTDLMPELTYKASVSHIYTVNGRSDTAEWRSVELTTSAVCAVPSDLAAIDGGTTEVYVTWRGFSAAYQVAWAEETAGVWRYGETVTDTCYTIAGLNPETRYRFKVLGICAVGDSSDWSAVCGFETEALPLACPAPFNLRVTDLTPESAVLQWDAEEAESGDIQGYVLRHRAASVQDWDSVKDLRDQEYALGGLTSRTAYVWTVRTVCTSGLSSDWAEESRFGTLADTTAVEDLAQSGLSVASAQGQIYVMNPSAVRIDNIRIVSTSGRCLESYAVRAAGNVVLPTAVRNRVAVVEVESAGRFHRFKLYL